MESYALFDLYEGAQIKEGYKSVAYSIVFRAKDKTLEDAEVTEAMERILKELEGMGIELRNRKMRDEKYEEKTDNRPGDCSRFCLLP